MTTEKPQIHVCGFSLFKAPKADCNQVRFLLANHLKINQIYLIEYQLLIQLVFNTLQGVFPTF